VTEPCPQRHLHADHITRQMLADGYMLLRCECGLTYAKKIEKERN
jgi:hypothetical protein